MILFRFQLFQNKHFLQAVNIGNQYQTDIVPVVNNANELMGSIAAQQLLIAFGNFSGANETGALLFLKWNASVFNF